MTNAEFSRLLDAALSTRQSPVPDELSAKVSLQRACARLMRGESLDGAEAEAHQECCRRDGINPGALRGIKIPWGALVTRGMKRDMSVGVFNQGGATVATDIADPIEILLNRATAGRLGARKITGLSSNVAFPRTTAAPTPYILPESATGTKSDPELDQISITPHRVTATDDLTRQLILQSSIGAEDYLRGLFADILMLRVDRLFYYGSGAASEPSGVINQPGIGSVIFGGAATYSSLVQFETSLGTANADVTNGRFGYVTSPATKAKLKTAAKLLTGATTVAATPLWEDGMLGSPDGKVNGYLASCTNQVQNNQVIFGNFDDAAICTWGSGPEVIINPYSRDTDAVVRITMHLFFDLLFRHAVSWCVSADSGAQ